MSLIKLNAVPLLALLLLAALSGCALAVPKDFTVRHGDRAAKRVAITIDDCFDIGCVRDALALSEQYGTPFTFFALGIELKQEDAEIWQAVAQSDCEIGNHTYGHKSLSSLSEQSIYAQLMRAQACLDEVLGYHYPMQVMRPPYGHLNTDENKHVLSMIEAVGFDHAILWDIDSTDPDECYKRVQNGSILLFHTHAKDLRCIEALLPRLLADGYELVTVSELLGKEPVVPSPEPYVYVKFAQWLEQRQSP